MMLILLQDVITVKQHWHNSHNKEIIVRKLQESKQLTLHALLR